MILRCCCLGRGLFTRAHIDGYAQAMVAEIELVLGEWRKRGASILDLGDELTRMTPRVVTRVLFGDDAGPAYEVIRRDFPIIDDALMRRGISPLKFPDRVAHPPSTGVRGRLSRGSTRCATRSSLTGAPAGHHAETIC